MIDSNLCVGSSMVFLSWHIIVIVTHVTKTQVDVKIDGEETIIR